jgi:hypothetical protein
VQRIILPWSQIHVPGICAEIVTDTAPGIDPLITAPPDAIAEISAAFSAFCASWQQGDRQGCALLRPLLAAHGIQPTVSC